MMRSLPFIFLIAVFGFCVFSVFTSGEHDDPADEATKFLKLVAADDYSRAVAEFGDNTCHCAPKGGYVAYLRMEKGHDPNIAFLRGQQFTMGQPVVKKLPFNNEKYIFPWDRPEDVAVFVPITFSQNGPYFLPMDMAFGYPTTSQQLDKFVADPSDGWFRAFTLRLRNSLAPGAVPKRDPNEKSEEDDPKVQELAKQILPPEALKYMHPSDAGPVQTVDGKTVPATAIADKLPRLKTIIVGMKIVRRGSYHRWAVKKVGVENPVVVAGGKDLLLQDRQAQPQPAGSQ